MNKTKFLYVFAPVMISIFCSCVPPQKTQPEKTPAVNYQKSQYEKNDLIVGSFSQIKPMEIKDFDIKELIFVTISSKGLISNAVVEEALLKRAKEIGADDIINIRIFKQEKGTSTKAVGYYGSPVMTTDSVEYHGSALAIKYRNSGTSGSAPSEAHVQMSIKTAGQPEPARRKARAQ